jgi:hypothetical protein
LRKQPTPTPKPQPKLRGEILERIELRQQIISVTLTLTGEVSPTVR